MNATRLAGGSAETRSYVCQSLHIVLFVPAHCLTPILPLPTALALSGMTMPGHAQSSHKHSHTTTCTTATSTHRPGISSPSLNQTVFRRSQEVTRQLMAQQVLPSNLAREMGLKCQCQCLDVNFLAWHCARACRSVP